MGTDLSSSTRSISDAADPLALADVVPRLLGLEDESARRCLMARCVALFPADALFPILKDESERHQHVDPRASLRLAAALVLVGEATGRPDGRGLGLLAQGDALRCLGRYEDSVATLDEAGAVFLAHGNEVGWARTRIGWLFSSHCLGHGEEAIAAVAPARDILVAHRQWLRAAGLDLNAARVCQELGQYERAGGLNDRAQQMYESLGQAAEAQVAWTKTNKGILLTLLGDFRAALRLHGEARELYVRRGDAINVLKQDHNIAYVYASQGHYTRALRHYVAVLAAHERAGLEANAAWVALNMVECYLRLNRDAEALEMAEEATERFERCGTPTEAAKARFYVALALAQLDEAARAFSTAGLGAQLALATLQRAALRLDDGDWSAALREGGQARALFAAQGLTIRQAQADLVRAWGAFGLGDLDAARELASDGLAIACEREAPWLEYEGRYVLGRVAQARGDLGAALDHYERAIVDIERMQHSLAVELRDTFLSDKVQVYEDAVVVGLQLAKPELAFAFLERAKSRALVDFLSGNREVRPRVWGGEDAQRLDELAQLREEHTWFYAQLYGYGLTRRDAVGASVNDDERLRAAIRDRERRIARLVERLTLDRDEGLTSSAPTDFAGLSPSAYLDEDTLLLEYQLRADGGAVFVVTHDGLTAVPLAASSDEVRRLLSQ